MTIAVKRFTSTMTGAPTLTGQVGTLVALLDACLKDGFNSKSVSSATQTAGVATVTTSTAHGYAPHDVVLIAGANESAWNGEFRVLTATTNDFTVAVAANAASPATGTLTVKIAPLGWTKPFSGTNKAVYLPQAQYVQCALRVQDDASTPTSANGRWAKARGYETLTDIDTGIGPFPTVAQAANALSICKSSTADATTRHWWLAGDGGIFYLGTFWYASGLTLASGYAFGDINSLRSGDAYSSLIVGDTSDAPNSPNQNGFAVLTTTGVAGHYLARPYNQMGSAVGCGKIGDNAVSTVMGYGGVAYPHPVDNGLLFAPVGIMESSCIRSRALPGLYQPLHTTPLAHLDTVTSLPDFPGRTVQAFNIQTSGVLAQCLIDITGPWR